MAATTTPRIAGCVCLIGAVDEAAGWLTQLLSEQGHTVSAFADARSLDATSRPPPDVLVIDARRHLPQAMAILMMARAGAAPDSAVIVLLGEDPAADLIPALAVAEADYLVWPARGQEIITRIDLALHRREHRRRARPDRGGAAQPPLTEPLHAAATRQQTLGVLFRHAFEHLPLGAVIASPANQIEHVNEALCRFLGYSPEELIGRQPGFMVLPEDHAATVARGHLLAAGQIDHFVQERRRYVRKDGSLALGKLTVYAPRDEAGRPLAFLAFIEDIGSRVWVEDQLARYTRYQQALANASLNLLTVAPDERARAGALRDALQQLLDGAATSRAYLFRNVEDPQLALALALAAEAWSAGQRSLHDSPGATRRPMPYAVLPRGHRERLLAGLPTGGLVEDIYAETPDLLQRVADEGIRSTQTVPVHVDGQLWGFLGFDDYAEPRVWDHTDLMLLTSAASMLGQTFHRWQIEDDLRATSQFLHTTGQVAHVGGWAVDVATRVPTLSEELASLLELAPGTRLDMETLLAFYAPEAQTAIRAAAAAAIRDGGDWELELPMITASGRRIWVSSQGQAERRDGRTVRLYGAVQDITRRKEAELRLEQQLRVEAALAKCAQELLTPISAEEDLSGVASTALEYLRSALAVDQAFLMRIEPEPEEPYLTLVAFASAQDSPSPTAHPLARRFPLSLLSDERRRALAAGSMMLKPPDSWEMHTEEQRAWLEQDPVRSRITIPVHIHGTWWGVLGFNGLAPREWGESEQHVLRTAAEIFGHALRRWMVERALRHSEEQFRTAVETMLDGFAIFDSVRGEDGAIVDFRYRYINAVGSQQNQRSREEHLGRTLLELWPAHRGTELFDAYVRLVETGSPVARESLVYEDRYGSGDRLARVFDVRAARLGDGFAMIWRDVTDRHLAHDSLTRANDDLLRRVDELRTLNLVAQTLAFTQDLRAGLGSVCAAIAERTGAAAAAIVGFRHRSEADSATMVPELDQLAGMSLLTPDELGTLGEALLRQRRPIALTRSGPDFPLGEGTLRRLQCAEAAHLLLVPLAAPTGNLGLLVLQSRPDSQPFTADNQSLAETMAGQIATAVANAQLGEQARRAAALAERNRVARDLHDSATQSLYSLVLIAAGWALKAEKGRLSDIPAKFTQLSAIAVQVLKELRLLIYELRHPDLEAAGLVKALEERLAAVEQRANITTTLEVVGELPGLAPDDEEQLYAMLQEALNNALRHARASKVAVTIRAEAGEAVFRVRDDGGGFDPDRSSGGLGLRSMQERATKIGALLTLSSQLGQGTCIEIRIPLTTTGEERHV